MMDEDILKEFIVEGRELIESLFDNLLALEKDNHNTEAVNQCFRAFHSLKGASGFLGLKELESITHIAESKLDEVRTGKIQVTSELISEFLVHADKAKAIVDGLGGAAVAETTAGAAEQIEEDVREEHDQSHAQAQTDSSIRVNISVLDRLMNLVSELVLARNQVKQISKNIGHPELANACHGIDQVTSEIQEAVMKTRMQPISTLWRNIPRISRDMSVELGKKIQIKMQGEATELDKSVMERIKDPLFHLIRNCLDHGIEKPDVRTARGKDEHGTIVLKAYHQNNQVNIEISDDGNGLDVAKIKKVALAKNIISNEEAETMDEQKAIELIFLPGFSTASEVTTISGRGVGMDVVKSNIEAIGGSIEVLSKAGLGSNFKIKIPLTLAIIPGLIVRNGDLTYAIPQDNLLELIGMRIGDTHKVEYIRGAPVYRLRGDLLPLVYLSDVVHEKATENSNQYIIVLMANDQKFGLVVDHVLDTQEIVVKPLGSLISGNNIYAGATIMGDGTVALILDVNGISRNINITDQLDHERDKQEGVHGETSRDYFVVEVTSGQEYMIPFEAVSRLIKVSGPEIKVMGNRHALYYAQEVLPVMELGTLLGNDGATKMGVSECTVVICKHAEKTFGVVVKSVKDMAKIPMQSVHRTVTRKFIDSSVYHSGVIVEVVNVASLGEMERLVA